MASEAWNTFEKNIKDVITLHNLHTRVAMTDSSAPPETEVLNRAGIVLTTSFWEAFCEDVAAEALEKIVASAKDASVLPKEIKKQIARELKANSNEVAVWDLAGDNWRVLLQTRLAALQDARNKKLNTPKSQNIDDLFESAIGLPGVSSGWTIEYCTEPGKTILMDADATRKKLDEMVTLRGEIAHRGKAKAAIMKDDVKDYAMFVAGIAISINRQLSEYVQSISGVKPW
ncbi:HEPN domain-containing protein [Paraburkholderia megapolitana]|uniref:RiboL-PSP-HEPN domain-containing protein n=1 Tax=Paraburkholderia megapolitana TaxID=420953 RepID=A0A1I3RVZ8_9BURK|nr:HEPN domain-containing protein [Paraburkholderia megapolitana]QDQ84032.1 hypothetical protein FNZ07_23150 [Paraburkholderia megapolitana]SFJ49436.1 hypothetical protein SAMN05192543_107417 [Paraburkholderia megapolitana]